MGLWSCHRTKLPLTSDSHPGRRSLVTGGLAVLSFPAATSAVQSGVGVGGRGNQSVVQTRMHIFAKLWIVHPGTGPLRQEACFHGNRSRYCFSLSLFTVRFALGEAALSISRHRLLWIPESKWLCCYGYQGVCLRGDPGTK